MNLICSKDKQRSQAGAWERESCCAWEREKSIPKRGLGNESLCGLWNEKSNNQKTKNALIPKPLFGNTK